MGKDNESQNRQAFTVLKREKENVEAAFGGPLDWQELQGKRACRIRKVIEGGWRSPRESWPATHAAMVDAMIRLDRALRPLVQGLQL